jgi:hypothetical protein
MKNTENGRRTASERKVLEQWRRVRIACAADLGWLVGVYGQVCRHGSEPTELVVPVVRAALARETVHIHGDTRPAVLGHAWVVVTQRNRIAAFVVNAS